MSLLELSEIGLSKLNEFQKNVLDECLSKESGGISLALGSGKTLLSIVLSIIQVKQSGHNSILVVVSKTLIENWVNEIKKFFGDSLKYIILHQEYTKLNDFELSKERLNFIIITPETLTKSFKDNGIKEKFLTYQVINEGRFNEHVVIRYNKPTRPYSNVDKGLGLLYSISWGCIIVDEVQKYTNITSDRCRAIGSLCSLYRWVLS
jgi:superfamily II DNA or RNA helicase